MVKQEETYVPRLVLIGRHLPRTGDDLEVPAVQTWSGQLDVHHMQRPASVGQNVSRNWKRLSRVAYHERSAILASPSGLVLPSVEDALENMRFFAEACDQFQGFHAVFDQSSMWGGLFRESMTSLQDLYPKSSILTFLLTPETALNKFQQRVADVLSLTCAFDASDLIIPLSKTADIAGYQALKDEERELLYARWMDNVTLPYRTGSAYATASPDMHAFRHLYSTALSCGAAQVSMMSGSSLEHFLSDQEAEGKSNGHSTEAHEGWMSCCPWMSSARDPSIQAEHVTLRGLPTKFHGSLAEAERVLLHQLSMEGIRRMCRTCIFPHSYPHGDLIQLMTRTMSSTELDRQMRHLCLGFMKERTSPYVQQMLEQWELHLSDSEHLCESLTVSISSSEEGDDASYDD